MTSSVTDVFLIPTVPFVYFLTVENWNKAPVKILGSLFRDSHSLFGLILAALLAFTTTKVARNLHFVAFVVNAKNSITYPWRWRQHGRLTKYKTSQESNRRQVGWRSQDVAFVKCGTTNTTWRYRSMLQLSTEANWTVYGVEVWQNYFRRCITFFSVESEQRQKNLWSLVQVFPWVETESCHLKSGQFVFCALDCKAGARSILHDIRLKMSCALPVLIQNIFDCFIRHFKRALWSSTLRVGKHGWLFEPLFSKRQ